MIKLKQSRGYTAILAAAALASVVTLTPVQVWAAPKAFTGAHLLPIAGEPVEDGVLLIDAGKIIAVGPRNKVRVPADAEVIDVSGKFIIPGLVDTHSHIGAVSGGDASDQRYYLVYL